MKKTFRKIIVNAFPVGFDNENLFVETKIIACNAFNVLKISTVIDTNSLNEYITYCSVVLQEVYCNSFCFEICLQFIVMHFYNIVFIHSVCCDFGL